MSAILPPNATKARLGGDEFVAMLAFEPAARPNIDALAAELVAALDNSVTHDAQQICVGASLGVSLASDASVTMETMVRRADIAMYHCKDEGRNRYCWFEPGMEMAVQVRNQIETGIREGMPRGEFVPHFEPQVDIASGRLIGFEMLMRWESPEYGMIPPERFIPVAEESGLIGELSLQVIRNAMEIAKRWDPSIMLAVNISPQQLKDPWFSQKLTKLLVETGFPASQLEVEITESSLFENLPLVRSIVTSLKNQGVSLSLDDFGTGYSSLSHLRALPFDRIKIDRSFVAAMRGSPDAQAIVVAIVRLGESLAMPITAEGVEDEATAIELTRLGCSKGQGWHFGRAASATDTDRLLAGRGLLRAPMVPPVGPNTSDEGTAAQVGVNLLPAREGPGTGRRAMLAATQPSPPQRGGIHPAERKRGAYSLERPATRQLVVENYIVDLACREAKLAIELDGSQHLDQQQYDEKRTAYLESMGLASHPATGIPR